MSWWRYRGRCTGRVLHFLYHYVGFDVAEHARIGKGIVELHGQRFATLAWSDRFGEADVPELGDCNEFLLNGQRTKREEAIVDAVRYFVPGEPRKPVDEDALQAVMPRELRSVRLHAEIVAKAQPQFFTAPHSGDHVLWCKAGKRRLYWHREIGAWLRGPDEEED